MKILLFGIAKDIVGQRELTNLNTLSVHTVDDLLYKLRSEFPDLKKISSLAIGVNQQYAESSTILKESDVVAIIPPVSGG